MYPDPFIPLFKKYWGFSGGSDGKESACNAGDPGSILGQEDPLEKGMATHSSILASRIPWTEEPGRLWSTGSERVRYNWSDLACMQRLIQLMLMILFPNVYSENTFKASHAPSYHFTFSPGLLWWLSGKVSVCQCRRLKRLRFDPWVGKIPWRRAWQPIPVFLLGKSHGQRSLVGPSSWDHKKSQTQLNG